MALRKTVFAEALDLLEDTLCKVQAVAPVGHALDQAASVFFDAALALPRGHGAAQAIGFGAVKTGRDHGNFHHLFLEDRDAQRALQGLLQTRRFVLVLMRGALVFDGQPLAPALARLEVGMHHATHNRPRPHDGDFDHQVVEGGGLQARQHRHLRAAFDLEHAHGVGAADHLVGRLVFVLDVVDGEGPLAALGDKVNAAADGREHAQSEHVHLHEAHVLQVVLVPLDDGAFGHGGVLHRHEAGEARLRQHKAAHVLAQVTRKAHQLPGKAQPQLGLARVQRHTAFAGQLLQAFPGQFLVEPVMLPGEGVDEHLGQGERLAHVADRAARAVADDHGGNRCALAAVFFVDVLDDLFAPLVFEVHVDVGRLIAPLQADEALQQRMRMLRVGHRDAQAPAHH